MNTFLTICLIVLPLSLLMGFAAYLARQSARACLSSAPSA